MGRGICACAVAVDVANHQTSVKKRQHNRYITGETCLLSNNKRLALNCIVSVAMSEVILLEDEPVLRQELAEFLDSLGYTPLCLSHLAAFEQQFDAQRHRLAVIDIGLPDGNGLELIRRLRQAQEPVGIVVFSAHNTNTDRIHGLEVGADYYLGKGCDLDELAATLAALTRRLQLVPPISSSFTTAHLPLDEGEAAVQSPWRLALGPGRLDIADAPSVPLSPQDATVLHCLMSEPGNVISRGQIVQALGANLLDYDQRRLDTQMYRLRQRVEEISGKPLPVRTLRNNGYCFYEPATITFC